jgi:hypothetical protein
VEGRRWKRMLFDRGRELIWKDCQCGHLVEVDSSQHFGQSSPSTRIESIKGNNSLVESALSTNVESLRT